MFVEKRFRRIGALGIPNLKKNYLALKSINSRKFFIAFAALLLIILAAITTAPLSSNHIRNFQAQYLIGSAEASANNVQMMPNAEHESYSSLLEARRKEIEKSLSITTIPKNLNPPLSFLQESWKYPNCLNSQIPSCILGNADGTNVLNVMGDSNAMALLPTIIQVFQGWKIVVLIHLGCPLSNFEIIFPGKTQVDNTCKIWRENSILYMKTNVPNLSLLTDGEDPASVGKEGYKVVFQNQTIEKSVMLTSSIRTAALNQTLNSIRDLHRPYIFVETIPKHPSIAECAIQMHLKSNCVGRSSQNLETSSIEKSVTKINKGYFLEIRPWLCASGYCPLIIDHTAVFADAHHISKPFALSNSSLLRAYLQEKNLL